MIVDQFSLYQTKVKEYLEEYTQVMQKHAPDYEGLSESINKLARPFIDGCFTLAVVGKMSAGKSTFINALIEDNNILPTDHFQTTCTLTKIRHGESKQVSVTYADGTIKIIKNDIEAGLKQLVAIPEEYRDLPINQINNLIIEGLTAGEIVSKLELLEEKAAKNINVKELKEYIKLHHRGNIVSEVIIELPLPSCYRGWQIIDTPGVDAIGGIEETTSEFLEGTNEYGTNNVDAVVFVHSGKGQIEDGSFNKFVKKTYDSLTEDAKRRMFFVITHASDSDFRRHKDANIANAKKLFVDYKYGFDENRLVCVDSLLALLHTYILKERVNAKLIVESDTPSSWENSEWEACIDLVGGIETELKRKKKEINNENILNLMEEIAGFSSFRVKVDEFVRVEKEKAFSNFVNKTVKDLNSCIKSKYKKLKILRKKVSQSNEEFKKTIDEENRKLEECRRDINEKLNFIRDDFPENVDQYFQKLVNENLNRLKFLKTPTEIRLELINVRKNLINAQNEIFFNLNEILEETVNSEKADIYYEPLDCEFIIDSTKADIDNKTAFTTVEKGKGISNWLARIFTTGGGYVKVYDNEGHINQVKHELRKKLIPFFSDVRDLLQETIGQSGVLISKEFKIKLDKQILEYSESKFKGENTLSLDKSEIYNLESVIDALKLVQQKTMEGKR